MPDRFDPVRIAAELNDCRQRGLDGLDRRTGNQEPVHAAELQRLAQAFAAATGLPDPDRIPQIKALLIAGIGDLRRQERLRDADLIRALFFGETTDGPIGAPGELLRMAKRQAGNMSEYRFQELRKNAMRSFANVLVAHVTTLTGDTVAADGQEGRGQLAASIGQVDDTGQFVELLATAEKVTIVGITNEDLLPMLKEALRLKRAASGRADAFWESLRIGFQSPDLLETVNDERLRLSDPAEALRQRREAAIWARRQIGVFLKRTGSTRWTMFESNYQPMPTGASIEFADGTKMARLLIRRPRRATAEQIYIEIRDPKAQIAGVFDEIAYTSKLDTMIVPVGEPVTESAFRCYGSRVQAEALQDNSREGGWLPMILVVTFRHYRGHVEPILQLRTPENSAREENRLSHIGGHIQEEDRLRPGGRQLAEPPAIFDLEHEVPICAARRIVRELTGAEPAAELVPVTASGYLYPDKESLFFFVYALNVPEGLHFSQPAEMQPFRLAQLLAVRANQAIRSAAGLCRDTDSTPGSWTAAARVAALNLTLHDHAELAETLTGAAHGSPAERAELALALDKLVTDLTATSRASSSREVALLGLAGWQYRHFFSELLPLYARIGVDGAAELLQSVTADPVKDAACRELADLYQDEQFMSLLPMEL